MKTMGWFLLVFVSLWLGAFCLGLLERDHWANFPTFFTMMAGIVIGIGMVIKNIDV